MVFYCIANKHVAAAVTGIASDAYLSDSQEGIADSLIERRAVDKLNTGSCDIEAIDHRVPQDSIITRPTKCDAVPHVDDKIVRNVILFRRLQEYAITACARIAVIDIIREDAATANLV
jgi:hypothetical protein